MTKQRSSKDAHLSSHDDPRVDIATGDDVNVDEDNAVGSPKKALTAQAPDQPDKTPDIMRKSFERETRADGRDETKQEVGDRRSLMGVPIDHNAPTNDKTFPPGVKAEDVVEPGKATPGSAPVDNKSGS